MENYLNGNKGNEETDIEPTDIYVTLYTDGTLGFSNNTEKIAGKEVLKSYNENLKDKVFEFDRNTKTANTPWFGDIASIKSVEIVNEIAPTNMAGWFCHCELMTEIRNLPKLKTKNVIDMAGLFYMCPSLSYLDLSGFNTENVTDMYGMFSGCLGLQSLNLSNFNTENVTDMYGMFSGCSGLQSLNLSNFNTQNVTNMAYMFAGINENNLMSLTEIKFSSQFNTENVLNMQSMFYNCVNLQSLDVSSFNTAKVTNMGFMFGANNQKMKLQSIIGIEKFNTSSVTDMRSMFQYCSNITGLENIAYDTSKVMNMSNMFYHCGENAELQLNSNFKIGNATLNLASMFAYSGIKTLPEGFTIGPNVTNISAMFDKSSLESLPESFSIGSKVIYGSAVFRGTKLQSLPSGFNLSNATSLQDCSWMFANCSQLRELPDNFALPNSLTNCTGMFNLCENLQSIPNTFILGDNIEQCYSLFDACTNLSYNVPNNFKIPSKVTDIRGMFKGCEDITFNNLIIPTGVTNIESFVNGVLVLNGNMTIQGNPTSYQYAFSNSAQNSVQAFVVNYTSNCSNIEGIKATAGNDKIQFNQI